MKLYDPADTTKYVEIPASYEDNMKCFLAKYKSEAKKIADDMINHGDN